MKKKRVVLLTMQGPLKKGDFAKWVEANSFDLRYKLGVGRHFGEWWGRKIGRGYGLTGRRFSLFNTARWSDPAVRPECCYVVPVLYAGPFSTSAIHSTAVVKLKKNGSFAAPGFMRPEGICIYHPKSGHLFKYTLGNDGHKGASNADRV